MPDVFLLIGSHVSGSILLGIYVWVGDTVSDLASRYLKITQDFRLYRYTASVISLGREANRVRLPGRRWSLALFSPVTLALFATVIGVRNQYDDGDGDLIRIYLVYAFASVSLFLFFAFAPAPTGPVWAIFSGCDLLRFVG